MDLSPPRPIPPTVHMKYCGDLKNYLVSLDATNAFIHYGVFSSENTVTEYLVLVPGHFLFMHVYWYTGIKFR